mgnify:CR=1 FL=1
MNAPVTEPESRRVAGGRLAAVGLLVNIVFASGKLVAGIVGHSAALIADAVESMTDIVGSIVIWGGLHYGARPADPGHPFGHGRAESLAALAVGGLVTAAGASTAVHAVRELLSPRPVPEPFTLVVLVVVVVVKETMYRFMRRAGRDSASTALQTEAWHHRSDAITSAAAFIGISISLIGGPAWSSADAWAALFASAVIVINGLLLLRVPLGELMDRQPADLPERIEAVAMDVEGVTSVEKIFVRRIGPRYLAEMHLRVHGDLPVREGHAIAGRARAAVRAALPPVADILIHLEPEPVPARTDPGR